MLEPIPQNVKDVAERVLESLRSQASRQFTDWPEQVGSDGCTVVHVSGKVCAEEIAAAILGVARIRQRCHAAARMTY